MNSFILDRRFWIVPLVIWTAAVIASMTWNAAVVGRAVEELGTGQAREVFRMMEAVRLWNARHGGVYVVQDEGSPANPYLDGKVKEVQIVGGRRLTLVNPAYMTRQMSAPISELSGLQVRITSLRPINPSNAADAWERGALESFEGGRKEHAEIVGEGKAAVLRYMAPLPIREACLECHAKQGYKLGDVRGGISVALPLASVAATQFAQLRNIAAVHIVGWALVAALTLVALSRSRRQVLALDRARCEQEALVDLRTAELRREVAERRQAETQLRLLVDASGNGLFGLGPHGECTFINPVALRLLGAEHPEDFLARPILDVIAADECNRRLHEAMSPPRSLHADDLVFCRLDGNRFHVEVHLEPIRGDGSPGAVVNFTDVTRRKAAEATIWRQAHYDALTGLPNRSLFNERLREVLVQARRSREIVALLFLDLDGFKHINDEHGHAAGDRVLRVTAERLQGAVRESDVAARLAGDEFVVILRHLARETFAGTVATKLLGVLAEPVLFGDATLGVAASIGIAIYPNDANTAEDLIRRADLAMYKAKEAGKHAWRCHAGGRYIQDWPAAD